jgi:hypothetical protein
MSNMYIPLKIPVMIMYIITDNVTMKHKLVTRIDLFNPTANRTVKFHENLIKFLIKKKTICFSMQSTKMHRKDVFKSF